MTAQNGPASRPGRPSTAPPPGTEVRPSVARGGDGQVLMTRLRQAAAWRLAPLPCGCRDPLPCRLRGRCPAQGGPGPEPDLTVAADELDGLGLCACWAVPRRHGAAR